MHSILNYSAFYFYVENMKPKTQLFPYSTGCNLFRIPREYSNANHYLNLVIVTVKLILAKNVLMVV